MLTEDHIMLRESMSGFLSQLNTIKSLREMLSSGVSMQADTWKSLSEMGWTGLLIDEEFGGSNLGLVSACLMAENIGRSLLLSPIISSALLSSFAINLLGTHNQKNHWLSSIASGKTILTSSFGNLSNNDFPTLIQENSKLIISGIAPDVVNSENADNVLIKVQKEGSDEVYLIIVNTNSKSIEQKISTTIDGRKFSKLSFSNHEILEENIIGLSPMSCDANAKINAFGSLIYASEQYGSAAAAFDLTLEYLKQREQFGKIIGTFQSLHHRMAKLYTELKTSEALNFKAAILLEGNHVDAQKFCSMAKAKSGQVSRLVTNDSIQLHGGIGMTDEYDVGLYLKRVSISEKMFGNTNYHVDNVATSNGF
jgi:alkylation response protein AidB-like acyl-CoA dehydrogenase